MVPNPVHRVPPKGAQGAFLALDPVHRVPAKNGAQGAPTNPVHRVPLLIRCTGCHYGFAIRCTGCPPRYKPRLKSTLCTGFFGTLCTGFFWGTLCTGPAPCAPEWPGRRLPSSRWSLEHCREKRQPTISKATVSVLHWYGSMKITLLTQLCQNMASFERDWPFLR